MGSIASSKEIEREREKKGERERKKRKKKRPSQPQPCIYLQRKFYLERQSKPFIHLQKISFTERREVRTNYRPTYLMLLPRERANNRIHLQKIS